LRRRARASWSPGDAILGQALLTELRALGVEAEFVRTDVRHEEEVRSLIDRTVERFGGWMSRSTTPAPKVSPVR